MNMKHLNFRYRGKSRQRGVATLLIALVLLFILTVIVLGASNVALFEQKTATNENRQHLADQAAEYYLGLGGEFLKANVENIASSEDDDGWLFPGGTNLHWQRCMASPPAGHPCLAESSLTRRPELYYYTVTGSPITNGASTDLNLPYAAVMPAGARLAKMGGATFPVTGTVRALLCRLDTTTGSTPSCKATPSTGNRIAITLIANARMDDESAFAEVKETWGTYSSNTSLASVPLVAGGYIKGLGDGSIVTAANAGGYGLPASMWSPNDVDVDGSGLFGGVGSFSTCHLGDFLGTVPVSELETTCAGQGSTGCTCANVPKGSPDMLSGHYGGTYAQERADVLDVDGSSTDASEDIQFFAGKTAGGVRMDHRLVGGACLSTQPYCLTDDNLFEWIFGQEVTGGDNDGYPVSTTYSSKGKTLTAWHPTATIAAAEKAALLNDLDAEEVPDCDSLDSNSSGFYYVAGACTLKTDIGSPDNPAVVVVDGDVTVGGNFNFFGMLFVRDAGAGASFAGHGNVNFFGSIIVEGDVDVTGNFSIIYLDTSTGKPGKRLPRTTRFARLPGSWLDSAVAF